MQKRLGIGFAKGTLIGLAVGLGVQLGLRWELESGTLLPFLLAMAVGGTAGVFGGPPPWREGAWLEALLKMLFGVAAGAAAYWAAARYAPVAVPFSGSARFWTEIPPLFLTPIGALYGALVELDHDPETPNAGASKSASKSRASTEIEDAELVGASSRPPKKRA